MTDVTIILLSAVPGLLGLCLIALSVAGGDWRTPGSGSALALSGLTLCALSPMIYAHVAALSPQPVGLGLSAGLSGETAGSVPAAPAPGAAMPFAAMRSTPYTLFVLALLLAAVFAAGVVMARANPHLSRRGAPSSFAAAPPEGHHAGTRALLKREHDKHRSASDMHRYLELATQNSQITIFLQDADLNYRWIVNPRLGMSVEDLIGKSDYEVLPPEAQPLVIGHKKRALATRSKQSFETEIEDEKDGKTWFRVDVVPVGGADGTAPSGIVCTAIDITRAKRLDSMRTDLSRRLAETLQRFNLALRSERIVVFSQDLQMRYTWANSDDTQVGSIIGRTDEEIIPAADRPAITELKRLAIDTKLPQSAEIGIGEGKDRRWYDLHVEPNIRPDGEVSGITCASIDVTHRKRNEEHMRLVMRELTHRTKNLLAVIIAIARQTSMRSGDVESFVPALIARLRALSAAQDLIVADDWAGVAIDELLKALVAQHSGEARAKVEISGPRLILSPEAAQNLGLAIHELAANAARFGALSVPQGKLSVGWTVTEGGEERDELDLVWKETGGPAVYEPTTRGFGMMVIERNLSLALGAEVKLNFAGEKGLEARIKIPLEGLVPVLRADQKRLAEAV